MRICFVTGEYPPMEGGVGAFTHKLASALQLNGHEVHVLTSCVEDADTQDHENGFAVHRQIAKWGRQGVLETARAIQRIAPDIVNLQYEAAAYSMKGWITLLPEVLGRRVSAPLAVTFHDLLPPYLFPKAGPLRQSTVWHLAKHADGIITTNAEDQNLLKKKLERQQASRIPLRRIPIGSNISITGSPDYDRAQVRASYGLNPNDLLVGFFGFMNRTKGIENLIRAIAALRDKQEAVHLLFVGGRTGTSDITNQSYAEEIDSLIESLALNSRVYRTGFASQQAVTDALHAIDICALPYCDGVNLRRGTFHAALAHGCAIITTTPRVPISELKNGVHAILVPPEDPVALSTAIHQLATAPELRAQLGTAGAAFAQRFTWPRIAADTVAFFESLS